jgi:hypothetical protein
MGQEPRDEARANRHLRRAGDSSALGSIEHPAIARNRLRKADDPEGPLELTRVRDGDLIT